MTAKIDNLNGFRARKALARAAEDPRIEEIEGYGMDPGRVFIHLADGFWFGAMEGTHSRSVGSADELKQALAQIEVEP